MKEVWVLVLGFFVLLSAFFRGFFLVLDPRALGGELGVLVRNLRTIMVIYRVNVFESSGAGSPGTEGGISG